MNRRFIVAISVILITLGIIRSSVVSTNAVTQTNDANNGAPPAKPSGDGSGPGGPSMDNGANVITNGAYVLDGTRTVNNSFNNALAGFLAIFGMEWYNVSETGKHTQV